MAALDTLALRPSPMGMNSSSSPSSPTSGRSAISEAGAAAHTRDELSRQERLSRADRMAPIVGPRTRRDGKFGGCNIELEPLA